jgi:putative SOS response-associated peptidase YedK
MRGDVGNMPPLPGVFPDYFAPIVRTASHGRELVMARWGMPSPLSTLRGRKSDPGVTNIRNVSSPHWRRWLGLESRCVVPFSSFSENEVLPDGSRPPVWFAFDESRPLAFFAGLWTPWTSVRKVKEGPTTNDLFAFLTTEPNAEVAAIHPKAMPVISDLYRRGRDMARGADRRGAHAAKAAARRRAEDRGARRQDRRRGRGGPFNPGATVVAPGSLSPSPPVASRALATTIPSKFSSPSRWAVSRQNATFSCVWRLALKITSETRKRSSW